VKTAQAHHAVSDEGQGHRFLKIIDTGVRRRRCDWTQIKWLTMLNSSSHIAFRPRHPHDARARPLIPER
jgi:hypothetical protein